MDSGPDCGTPWRRGKGLGSGLAGLHMKDVSEGKLSAVCRTWLFWGSCPCRVSRVPRFDSVRTGNEGHA